MKIAITRPEGKGAQLKTLLAQNAIEFVHTSVLSVSGIDVSSAQLSPIQQADVIVFISQDAVVHLAEQDITLPEHATLLAVGEQTAKAIQQHFGRTAKYPQQQDSEGLIALPELQALDGKQCVLVKGKGGRTLIAITCKERGAILNQCVVYQRQATESSSDEWLDHWRSESVTAIVLSSNAAIDAVFNTESNAHLEWLKAQQFFVVSARSAEYISQQYSISKAQVHVSSGASDEAVFNCIQAYSEQQGSSMSEQAKPEQNNKPDTPAQAKSQPQPAPVVPQSKQKISKVGVLALIVALATGVATSGLIIHGQQISDKTYAALDQLKAQNRALSEELAQSKQVLSAMQASQQSLSTSLTAELNAQANELSDSFAAQLQSSLTQADQQLSGAAKQEAAYLHRLAIFKVAAEQDYQGAAAVLKRVAQTLQGENNNSEVLKAIANDIARLNAQPQPAIESLYLDLYGLLEQVEGLSLVTLTLPETRQQAPAELSADVDDWQSNLKRTWQGLVDDFIKVRERDVPVIDPLLDAQEQHLLRAQLRAYLSQAQTALMDKQASIFFSALKQAEQHTARYFDSQDASVSAMLSGLNTLQQQPLQFSKGVVLKSEAVLKEWLND